MIGFREAFGRLKRWLRPGRAPTTSVDDPDLRVVAGSRDASESATAVLERASELDPTLPAVLCHFLDVPTASAQAVRDILDRDGWHVAVGEAGTAPDAPPPADQAAELTRLLARGVLDPDPANLARENSRMVGLAQRFAGYARGWDVLQPADRRS